MTVQEDTLSMMTATRLADMPAQRVCALPVWVPKSVRNYLAHTEAGVSIRELAREGNCHASTVLRQIRKLEQRRDDPLVDAALRSLGQYSDGENGGPVDAKTLATEGLRIMRCLCERGALLAVAQSMEKAVVVRDGITGDSTRTGVVDRAVAQAMALKGWIATREIGKISRYRITAAGKGALAELMARSENAQVAGAEAEPDEDFGLSDASVEKPARKRLRYNTSESPLAGLSRRKDRDGSKFLQPELVQAGEQLREDFELAQMSDENGAAWAEFLCSPGQGVYEPIPSGGACEHARKRVAAALIDLGPGLADVVLRCCCFLEGLEDVEKHLGWSARSGKIVLRIGLVRLRRHLDIALGPGGGLIG